MGSSLDVMFTMEICCSHAVVLKWIHLGFGPVEIWQLFRHNEKNLVPGDLPVSTILSKPKLYQCLITLMKDFFQRTHSFEKFPIDFFCKFRENICFYNAILA